MTQKKFSPTIDPKEIRKYYASSLENKVLFTGHSHRAWPEAALGGHLRTFELAKIFLDKKWDIIFNDLIPKFQKLIASRMGIDAPELIANDENTHNLLIKILSCFPWDQRTKIVTTDSEFYSARRQLFMLKEAGVQINFISTNDKNTLTERLIEAIDSNTNIVLLSTVFFNDGFVLQNLKKIIEQARKVKATIILDAYHQFNIRKLNIDELGKDIFVLAGAYKYAQAGEGAAWLKVPQNCKLRPLITGWFAGFSELESDDPKSISKNKIQFNNDASRFYSATRDYTGISRLVSVLEWMDKLGLTVDVLEKNNLAQTQYLIDLYDELNLNKVDIKLLSSRKDQERGPFIALEFKNQETAQRIQNKLYGEYKIYTDSRGQVLRLGPAEYNLQEEMQLVMRAVSDCAKLD